MKFGYARVSTAEQDTALQLKALRAANVERVWEDQISGVKHRPQLEALLDTIGPGDVLVVYKVDRLARSLQDLMRIAERISASGASLQSLTEPIETTTPVGRMMFQMLGAFAEFERSVIRERCNAGTQAAMARGVRCHRPRKLDYSAAFRMRNEGKSLREIATQQGVCYETVRNAFKKLRKGTAQLEA